MMRLAGWARHSRARRILVLAGFALLGLAIGIALGYLPAGVVIGLVLLAMFGATFGVRSTAHEQGYWDAKVEMYGSLAEAQDRGISLDDWVKSDMERTMMRAAYGPPSRRMLKLAKRQARVEKPPGTVS